MMDKNQILKLIQDEIQKEKQSSQYSVSRVPFHTHNNIDSSSLQFTSLSDVPGNYVNQAGKVATVNTSKSGLIFSSIFQCIAKNTNGTTNIDVFDANGAPFAFTVTGVYLISKDTTAGNITLLQESNTVCTIAKGTVSGAMVGATSLSNTTYAIGDVCQVKSSTAGDATVFITFITS